MPGNVCSFPPRGSNRAWTQPLATRLWKLDKLSVLVALGRHGLSARGKDLGRKEPRQSSAFGLWLSSGQGAWGGAPEAGGEHPRQRTSQGVSG